MDYKHSYDQFDFVNNGQIMDIFICKICHSVSKDPYETQCCKNTFCKSCIDTAKQKGITDCPLCRKNPYQIIQAVQISRQIQTLLVYCKNKNQGCTWKGALETKNMHLGECLFETVRCEYHIIGCDAMVRRDLQRGHNITEKKKHFSMVAKCVEEKLKLRQQLTNSEQKFQDTRQQLAYSERKLKNIQQELNESNSKVEFYKEFYEGNKINAIVKELEDTKKELEDTKKELKGTKTELKDTKKELEDTKKELEDTKKELEDTKKELKDTKKELEDTKKELKETKKELKETKKELEDTKKESKDAKKELEDTKVKLADSNESVDKLTFYIVISFIVVTLIFSLMIKRCFV